MSLIVKERVARFTSSRLCWAKCDAVEGREMNFGLRHPARPTLRRRATASNNHNEQ